MAVLNVFLSSKLPSTTIPKLVNPRLLTPSPDCFSCVSPLPPRPPPNNNNNNNSTGPKGPLNHSRAPQNAVLCLGELSRASFLALLSASLVFASDPALAFKGGGPYGSEVTRGQDLSGKDFSGKNLTKQDFKTSILRQANFNGATLVGASFFDADLTGADLSDADLRGADFSLANVTKANLTNANLEGALATGNTSFRGTIIIGADFTDVPLRDDQRDYLCKVADGVNPTTGNATRDTLFCN